MSLIWKFRKRWLTGINMPVSGLPVAMNGILTDLLQEQALPSWKVVEDTTVTVVVLRFSPTGRPCCHYNFSTRALTSRIQEEATQPSTKRSYGSRGETKSKSDQASVSDTSDCSMPYLCQHNLPNELTLTVALLKSNSLTVHTLSVRQTHVKPGRTKQTVVFYTELPEPDP